MVNAIGSAGVVLDIVGAGILARALVRDRPEDFLPTVIGGTPHPNVLALMQRGHDVADAQVGVGLLVLGFVLQLIGNFGVNTCPLVTVIVAGVTVLVLVLAVPAWRALRHHHELRFIVAGALFEGSDGKFLSMAPHTMPEGHPVRARMYELLEGHPYDYGQVCRNMWGDTIWTKVLERNPDFPVARGPVRRDGVGPPSI